jgi:hypothetical protein
MKTLDMHTEWIVLCTCSLCLPDIGCTDKVYVHTHQYCPHQSQYGVLDTRGAMWESNRQPADKRRINACLTRGLDTPVRGTCDENQNAMPHLPGYVHDMYGVGIDGYRYGPGLTPPLRRRTYSVLVSGCMYCAMRNVIRNRAEAWRILLLCCADADADILVQPPSRAGGLGFWVWD